MQTATTNLKTLALRAEANPGIDSTTLWLNIKVPHKELKLAVCPIDGARLFVGPGGNPYCDQYHSHTQVENYNQGV